MIVVSGVRRSGTSLTMACLAQALGQHRIVGRQWPQEAKREAMLAARDRLPEAMRNQWDAANAARMASLEDDLLEARDMNPTGYWESRYTIPGIQWHEGLDQIPADAVCKVVAEGLGRSDPRYVNRVLYCLRHPREVARSQERLRRIPGMSAADERPLRVHSPAQWCETTAAAAGWLLRYRPPTLIIRYDRLVTEPEPVLAEVRGFLGEGNFSRHPVDSGLRRSAPDDRTHEMFPAAEAMWAAAGIGDWQQVLDVYQGLAEPILRRDQTTTLCVRLNERRSYRECVNCRDLGKVLPEFRRTARRRRIAWDTLPCRFETETAPDRAHISEAASIAENHWFEADGGPVRGIGDVVAALAGPVARMLGKERCRGCQERRDRFNRLLPFRGRSAAALQGGSTPPAEV